MELGDYALQIIYCKAYNENGTSTDTGPYVFCKISVYVCIYVCMYVCMHVCVCECMYVCMHVCVCECMYACVYVNVFMYVCLFMSALMSMFV